VCPEARLLRSRRLLTGWISCELTHSFSVEQFQIVKLRIPVRVLYSHECQPYAGSSPSMKKTFTLCAVFLIALASVELAFGAANDLTISGYISCSACGVKGVTPSHADCMQKCLTKGAGVVIVLDGDQRVLAIENPDAVVAHAAHRVALFGYKNATSFHVISVRIL
jgi:hypothetical protein